MTKIVNLLEHNSRVLQQMAIRDILRFSANEKISEELINHNVISKLATLLGHWNGSEGEIICDTLKILDLLLTNMSRDLEEQCRSIDMISKVTKQFGGKYAVESLVVLAHFAYHAQDRQYFIATGFLEQLLNGLTRDNGALMGDAMVGAALQFIEPFAFNGGVASPFGLTPQSKRAWS